MTQDIKSLLSTLDAVDLAIIGRLLSQAHEIRSADDYDIDYDDTSAHLLEEIGDIIYEAAFPEPEPEDEDEPEPLAIGEGERAFYCRKCQSPRAFVLKQDEWTCPICGYVRRAM